MYSEDKLVRIARRENNSKRSYLVINLLQGKHYPAAPGAVLRQFSTLAQQVKARVAGERVLVVGFAETATAIGASLAKELACTYLQTTRENLAGRTYLHFTEAHSHATEQKLDRAALARILPDIDHIVFAEDELTTGNTLLDLIRVFKRAFGPCVHFSAACLVSSLSDSSLARFQACGLALDSLVSVDHSSYHEQALRCTTDGAYHRPAPLSADVHPPCSCYPDRLDARELVDGAAYHLACEALWQRVHADFPITSGERILVLGTEEFMYPGLHIAAQMEQLGATLSFHATTRSPIATSADTDSLFRTRHELKSLYDDDRTTFVYELTTYDRVFIVTDAPMQKTLGLRSLLAALEQAGNTKIHVIRWCDA